MSTLSHGEFPSSYGTQLELDTGHALDPPVGDLANDYPALSRFNTDLNHLVFTSYVTVGEVRNYADNHYPNAEPPSTNNILKSEQYLGQPIERALYAASRYYQDTANARTLRAEINSTVVGRSSHNPTFDKFYTSVSDALIQGIISIGPLWTMSREITDQLEPLLTNEEPAVELKFAVGVAGLEEGRTSSKVSSFTLADSVAVAMIIQGSDVLGTIEKKAARPSVY